MATERQIAANRRNAQKSTGPKTVSGKKQSSQNAYRHGLSLRISGTEFEKQIKILAREIAGDTKNEMKLTYARDAAEAELELQRIRQLKAAMYEFIRPSGDLDEPRSFRSDKILIKSNVKSLTDRGRLKLLGRDAIDPSIDALAIMPKEELDWTAEAARHLLSELVSLLRYENRAAGRRDLAIRKMKRKTVPGATPT
jgi:hypothetical protein